MDELDERKSATARIYAWLCEHKERTFTSNDAINELQLPTGSVTGAFHRFEKQGVIKGIGKDGRAITYKFESEADLVFRKSSLGSQLGREVNRARVRNASDFEDYTPITTVESDATSQPELPFQDVPKRSLSERILDLAIEVNNIIENSSDNELIDELLRRGYTIYERG